MNTLNRWTARDIPPQHGRTVVITGTGGLGFETAKELARAGAEVIIAGRNQQKGAEALNKVRADIPMANVQFEQVDLASLQSVNHFASRMRDQRSHIDMLINNAGVMVPPQRQVTQDGFELQFGTNYLSHFALTARLLPLLQAGNQSRIVTLSSIAARNGEIHFDDLQAEHRYQAMPVYAQSKLACLIFALELHRRSVAGGWGVSSFAAHPGISRTDLLHNAPGRCSLTGLTRSFLWFLFQPAAQGALPTLFAATNPKAEPGAYYGPDRLRETRGFPTLANVPAQALDQTTSTRLWTLSETLSHTQFPTT